MHNKISLAILAPVSALTAAASLAPASAAQGNQDNYCLQGRQSGYPGNCEFSTYQQCQATASGTGEGCGINPMKAGSQQRRAGYEGRY
jgi:hypothetical protein